MEQLKESAEISASVNAVLAIVYKHIDYCEDELELLIDKRGVYLSLKNINYNPNKPLLTETLTILLKNTIIEIQK